MKCVSRIYLPSHKHAQSFQVCLAPKYPAGQLRPLGIVNPQHPSQTHLCSSTCHTQASSRYHNNLREWGQLKFPIINQLPSVLAFSAGEFVRIGSMSPPKVAIITSGASGFGLAVIEVLVSKRWKVHIFDLNHNIGNAAALRLQSTVFHKVNITS